MNALHMILTGCYPEGKRRDFVLQGGMPPFEWTQQFSSVPHTGMPQKFDFEFERQQPLHSVAVV